MENRSSCNIITSHLEGRTITHEWTDVYLPTSSPVDAVIAYNKRKHKYIAMNRLLHHLPTVDLSNYVFSHTKRSITLIGEKLEILVL